MNSMSKKTFTIIQDTREKKPWIFSTNGHVEDVLVQKLDTGDYSIVGMEDIFMVERKASVDELFVNLGVQWERFTREMERAKPYKYKYLVVEATASQVYNGSKYSKMNGKFIMARLMRIMTDYGVVPIFAGKTPYTTVMIEQLMRSAISRERRDKEDGDN